MKKKLPFFTTIMFIALISKAQPSLTSSVHIPNVGDVDKYYNVNPNGIQTGANGANQTWDFSQIKIDKTEILKDSYIDPKNTSFSALFPTANIASEIVEDDYSYFKTSTSDVRLIGHSSFLVNVIYPDDEIIMKFPFTYNTTFSDSFNFSTSSFFGSISGKGQITVTGLGYGKLILPQKTYNNVLKVWSYENAIQELDGTPIDKQENTIYNWYDPLTQAPIFSINIYTYTDLTDNSVEIDTTVSVNFLTIPTGIIENNFVSFFSVYPNPSKGISQISYTLNQASQVKISLVNSIGEQVFETVSKNQPFGNHTETINLENLAKGIYLINLQTESGVLTKKIFIE